MNARILPATESRPRVLHIVPALFGADDGIVGGAERYAFELARFMAAEVPTTLVTFGERERNETVDQLNIRVIGNPWYVRKQRTNPISLALLTELRQADVVHCHQQHVLASSFAAVVGKLSKQRVFVSDLGGGGWDVSAYVSTDRWYDGHLHLSEYSRKVFGHGAKTWAHVILGGVDTEKFSPDESVQRDGGALFVGRLLPHKGVDDLVSAVPADMSLKIIGRASHSQFLKDLHALAEGKQVSLDHDCDDATLVRAYRRALCVVLPSVYKNKYGDETRVPELLGQTLLESMACGTPVICTNVASMPEIVSDGVTGFVVPPNDPHALGERLRWFREHPAETAELGRAARRSVMEKFTWPRVVQRCLEIYAS
ncbi:MAG TPA: glycosyltransferase family 4 protein [Pyrinomonadaceae bacterium]|nr:glycosyltransferase family 4 protein [Pyrinomonadaceae bacterium]